MFHRVVTCNYTYVLYIRNILSNEPSKREKWRPGGWSIIEVGNISKYGCDEVGSACIDFHSS